MAELLGQSSGGFTESSSALRILHVGIRNNMGILTDDAFTQTNPPLVVAAATISAKVDTTRRGVLSGSVAFTRPDAGANYIGGNCASPMTNTDLELFVRPVGCFINSSNGNAYENLPGLASGKGPYVSAMGSYGNALYETQLLGAIAGDAAGTDLAYTTGANLIASINGYLMPGRCLLPNAGAVVDLDTALNSAERYHGAAAATVIGRLLVPADSDLNELVYNQLI